MSDDIKDQYKSALRTAKESISMPRLAQELLGTVTKKGKNYFATRCPGCSSTNTFFICAQGYGCPKLECKHYNNPQAWKSGDQISFIQDIKGCNFKEAGNTLLEMAGLPNPWAAKL